MIKYSLSYIMKKTPHNVIPYSLKTKKNKYSEPTAKTENICMNTSCKLRKAGCRGFEGCPGYKGK